MLASCDEVPRFPFRWKIGEPTSPPLGAAPRSDVARAVLTPPQRVGQGRIHLTVLPCKSTLKNVCNAAAVGVQRRMNQRVIMLSSPKGGVGKSSLARNILVLAAKAGMSSTGLDFDRQATLATWAQRRERVHTTLPDIQPIPVESSPLDDWREALRRLKAKSFDVAVIDTPPSIEINLSAVISMTKECDLILVPCQQTQDDVDSVLPWMKRLLDSRARASFVLNRSNRRAKSFGTIRAKLLSVGPVCPVEIPQLEEIPLASGKGLGVMDLARPSSGETFESLWSYVSREAGL